MVVLGDKMKKIRNTISNIGILNEEAMKAAKKRQDFLTKPKESLGILEDLSIKVAGITGNVLPKIRNKVIITMVGDHGVVEEGVSAYPQEVTSQMVYNFIGGGAGINVLARHAGARLVLVDMGVATDLKPHPKLINKKIAYGTKNMARGPAMTYEQAIESIEAGIDIVKEQLEKGIDIIGIGEMGIGNTTTASAIIAAITSEPAERIVGRGTGIGDKTLRNKIEVIKKALEVNKPDLNDPIDVLAKVGGFEIGGLVGVILESAANRIPIVLDGFEPGAAALIATELEPKVKNFLIAPICSREPGDKITLKKLGLVPFLNLKLNLGEGTGAVLGISIVEAGVKILTEMATFAEAGVAEAIKK